MVQMTNDELAGQVLSWAKEKHPDKYRETVGVSVRPRTYRAYLLRLIEIRWEEDPEWRHGVPYLALEETAIVARFKAGDGTEVEVKGRKAIRPERGETREWGWAELHIYREYGWTIEQALMMKSELDLVVNDGQPTEIVKWTPPPREEKAPKKPYRPRRGKSAKQQDMNVETYNHRDDS